MNDADRKVASEIADEVLGAFADLYPRISLPFDVWGTLREMIEREVLFHYAEGFSNGASGIASSDLYIDGAHKSGLR